MKTAAAGTVTYVGDEFKDAREVSREVSDKTPSSVQVVMAIPERIINQPSIIGHSTSTVCIGRTHARAQRSHRQPRYCLHVQGHNTESQTETYFGNNLLLTLNRNRNHFLEPDHRRFVTMYSNELPIRLFEQVTKVSDGAFLAIKEAHHLLKERNKKCQLSNHII